MTRSSARRNFVERPEYLARDFLDHLLREGKPQTWPHITNEPPPKGKVEVLYANFLIPKGHERAPCPICKVEKKYLKGHLLWSPEPGTLHAVGHCCGHDYFGGNELERSLRDTVERTQRRVDEAFLWANWQLPGQLLKVAADAQSDLRACDSVITALRRSFPKTAYRDLKQAGKNGGILLVERVIVDQRGKRTAEHRRFSEEPLRGLGWLTAGRAKSLEGTVRAATVPLEYLRWTSEDDAVGWLMSFAHETRRLREHVEAAVVDISSCFQRKQELATFLEPSNLELLTRWSTEALGHNAVKIFLSGQTLTLWRGTEGKRGVRLPDNIWQPLPPLPAVLPPKEEAMF
jgi:hypothetical protein